VQLLVRLRLKLQKSNIGATMDVAADVQELTESPIRPELRWIMDIPERLRILGKSFEVMVLSPEQDTEVNGWMKLDKQQIWVRILEAKEQVQDTMLHEIIHAVDESLSLGMREKQVFALAAGLLAVLKDNPNLLAWLSS
jgi:hypothetical protein